MHFVEQKYTLIKTKRNRKWKIPHTVLERRTLCFSSYNNRNLKVKLWWVRARERKKRAFFAPFILSKGKFFKICFISLYSVLNTLSERTCFYLSKKHYFVHFCCLFWKSSKAFSVSLNRTSKLLNQPEIQQQHESWLKNCQYRQSRKCQDNCDPKIQHFTMTAF